MQVLDRLTPIEQQLLSQRLTQLRHVLDPGFSPLNWNSLGIPDFVATCNKVSCAVVLTVSHLPNSLGMFSSRLVTYIQDSALPCNTE